MGNMELQIPECRAPSGESQERVCAHAAPSSHSPHWGGILSFSLSSHHSKMAAALAASALPQHSPSSMSSAVQGCQRSARLGRRGHRADSVSGARPRAREAAAEVPKGKMQQLPSSTVRLLSSSQVVTSVVNVVKELLENALDARASSVDIKLENYGFDKIEIRDNGDGIKATDTPVMAIRHYTSKISSHEDLERLETYGFRGEALGSICSLAEVFITTKTAEDEFSTQYTLDSTGHVTSQKPSYLGQGTTVTVLKLFKNLPVRKQYFSTSKKCKDELKKIQDLLMAYGIIKPELRITFTHNKAVIWQKTRVSNHKTAFMTVLGTAIMSSMVPFQHHSKDPEISLSGFLPNRDSDCSLTSLSSPERSFIFINQRPVCQKEILKLVRQYYNLNANKDSARSYPVFFINITIPASTVDVNVTPDKTQVMMQNKESVLLAVENVLTSLYGPLPGTVSRETDKADVACTDMFVNTAQTDVLVNEIEPSGNDDPKTHTASFSFSNDVQHGRAGKNTEVCFKHQIVVCDNPLGLVNENEASGIDTAGSDIFQDSSINNISSHRDSQSEYGVTFAIADTALMDSQSVNDKEAPQRAAEMTALERIEEAPTVSKDTSEICADSWSMGNALKNSKGENLEPVKVMIPGEENLEGLIPGDAPEDAQNPEKKATNKNLCQKISNVVNEKLGQVTAYDLISNRVVRKPMSASDLFLQEYRLRVLADNPRACIEDITVSSKELWKTLSEEEKEKFEEKAAKDLERYTIQTKKAADQSALRTPKQTEKRQRLTSAQKPRTNGPLSNQQILDKLFQSQNEKKSKACPVKIVPIPFTLNSLKRRLQQLSEKCDSDGEELGLINKLSFPGAWIIASEKKIMLLNPYRVEEALLFKRLLENHKIPAETLDNPIVLTDSLLGGSHHMNALCSMQKDCPKLDGWTYFSDQRLVANGFILKILPGALMTENRVEVEGMTDVLPYYGLSDLKEILNTVVNKNASKTCECRPLKVRNYLQGEAVRLSRQLPLYLSNEDVQDTISRMKQQLTNENKGCVHGRPFFHHLTDIPEAQ